MTRQPLRTAVTLAVVASVSVGALTGCEKAELKATESLDRSSQASLTESQVKTVLSSLDDTIAAGDKDHKADSLKARFEDPALTMRVAQYDLNGADKDLAVPQLLTSSESLTVSNSVTWPRVIVDVTKQPEGSAPLILFIRQDDARSPYRLWQWMHLLPGQSVPSTAGLSTGASIIAPGDGDGLTGAPKTVADAWAKAVPDEKAQESAGLETDEFIENIRGEQKNWKDAIGDTGQIAYTITPSDTLLAIRDEDSGALVATSYTYRTDVTIKDGEGGIQMGGDVGAKLGDDGKVTGKAHWTYVVSALIHIPASSDKKAKARVIAGEKVLTEASRD